VPNHETALLGKKVQHSITVTGLSGQGQFSDRDKGYRAEWIDEYLLELGIQPVTPSKENEDGDVRPVAFDPQAYHQRNIVERLIGWLKESRRVLTRFGKTAKNYFGMIKMAFIHRYSRLLCSKKRFPTEPKSSLAHSTESH
jgi:Transposase DDE domain